MKTTRCPLPPPEQIALRIIRREAGRNAYADAMAQAIKWGLRPAQAKQYAMDAMTQAIGRVDSPAN